MATYIKNFKIERTRCCLCLNDFFLLLSSSICLQVCSGHSTLSLKIQFDRNIYAVFVYCQIETKVVFFFQQFTCTVISINDKYSQQNSKSRTMITISIILLHCCYLKLNCVGYSNLWCSFNGYFTQIKCQMCFFSLYSF